MNYQWMIIFILSLLTGMAEAQAGWALGPPSTPIEVAETYLEAMEANDLDRAEALFGKESSVFETGGVEGAWRQYREHHIGPELGQFASLTIAKGDPEEERSDDASMAFVGLSIDYIIEYKDGTVVKRVGTVSFVLVKEEGEYRIRHLHWSSHRKRGSRMQT